MCLTTSSPSLAHSRCSYAGRFACFDSSASIHPRPSSRPTGEKKASNCSLPPRLIEKARQILHGNLPFRYPPTLHFDGARSHV
jgi:hypothetical protein